VRKCASVNFAAASLLLNLLSETLWSNWAQAGIDLVWLFASEQKQESKLRVLNFRQCLIGICTTIFLEGKRLELNRNAQSLFLHNCELRRFFCIFLIFHSKHTGLSEQKGEALLA